MISRFIFILFSISSCLLCYVNAQENNNSLLDYIKLYQKTISHIRPDNCPMYPSCSNYGINSYKQFNPVKATLFTADRLLRCGHDHRNYFASINNNKISLYDPVFETSADKKRLLLKSELFFATYDKERNDSLKFIAYLINTHLYEQALLEIKRITFNTSFDSVPVTLLADYIICNNALNHQEEILFEFESNFSNTLKENPLLLFYIAGTWFRLENYDNAIMHYNKSIERTNNDNDLKTRCNLMKGLCEVRKNNWKVALDILSENETTTDYAVQTQKNIAKIQQVQKLKYKKPATASLLAIIPGAGYLYSGHKQTALSALIFNGLLGWATYSNIRKENYGMAALTGTFALSFYIANISGSNKAAKRYNNNKLKILSNQIQYSFNY